MRARGARAPTRARGAPTTTRELFFFAPAQRVRLGGGAGVPAAAGGGARGIKAARARKGGQTGMYKNPEVIYAS